MRFCTCWSIVLLMSGWALLCGCREDTSGPLKPTFEVINFEGGHSARVHGREGDPAHFKKFGRSQRMEDMHSLLQYFWGVRGGVVVESGALDGLRYSNTVVYSKLLQWKAVLIEASPDQFKKMVVNRPEAISVNAALCSETQKVHWLNTHPPATRGIYEFMGNDTGPKTKTVKRLKRKYEDHFKRFGDFNETILDKELRSVSCIEFNSLMNALQISKVDLWFLDVEGGEMEVLRGWNHSLIKVDVLVIEKVWLNKSRDPDAIMNFMTSIRYTCIDDDSIDMHNYWCSSPSFKPRAYPHHI